MNGNPIPKPIRVQFFSPSEWEAFIEEWAVSIDNQYVKVRRLGGSGDLGVDIVGFVTSGGWNQEWDNFQCKQYKNPLCPSDIWVEIGKIIYYSYKGEYSTPRKHYFVPSKGVGTSLEKLLGNPKKLKEEAKAWWDKYCRDGITKTVSVKLEGDFLQWFNAFDFSIFSSKSFVDLIEDHSRTHYHAVRFGGGLPARPQAPLPPDECSHEENRYVQQLFAAYQDHLKASVNDISDLSPTLARDFQRQRTRFYHAESLRNFARDTVPVGTFEKFQDEVFHGVIDTCDSEHSDGLSRMKNTLNQAANLSITSNPLTIAAEIQDKQGVCHQLANDNRLIWVPQTEEA